jgi:PD-(D/E)XK nuclease superfamily
MRQWLALDDPPPGWMAANVDVILDRAEADARESGDGVVKWRDAGDKAMIREWCRECVTRLEPILYELVIPHEYESAVRFTVPLTIPGLDGAPRQVQLAGEMDLRTWRPGKVPLSVDDLKATEDTSYWRKTSGQLVFYEIACYGMTGRWPEVSRLIQPMCPEQVISFSFTAEDRRQMFVTICSVAADIWSKNLPPKSSSAGCDRCPVRHGCVKFSHGRGRVPLAG